MVNTRKYIDNWALQTMQVRIGIGQYKLNTQNTYSHKKEAHNLTLTKNSRGFSQLNSKVLFAE